jgi:hypothetical protein
MIFFGRGVAKPKFRAGEMCMSSGIMAHSRLKKGVFHMLPHLTDPSEPNLCPWSWLAWGHVDPTSHNLRSLINRMPSL